MNIDPVTRPLRVPRDNEMHNIMVRFDSSYVMIETVNKYSAPLIAHTSHTLVYMHALLCRFYYGKLHNHCTVSLQK